MKCRRRPRDCRRPHRGSSRFPTWRRQVLARTEQSVEVSRALQEHRRGGSEGGGRGITRRAGVRGERPAGTARGGAWCSEQSVRACAPPSPCTRSRRSWDYAADTKRNRAALHRHHLRRHRLLLIVSFSRPASSPSLGRSRLMECCRGVAPTTWNVHQISPVPGCWSAATVSPTPPLSPPKDVLLVRWGCVYSFFSRELIAYRGTTL